NQYVHKHFDNPVQRTAPPEARVPASLSLGGVEIRPATVLAPMAGITDTVFRRFIRDLGGCGLMMTEVTSADGLTRHRDKKAQRYLTFYGNEHPISAQLFGSAPKTLADAARVVEDMGFDLVDLNLGCPAKKVVSCNGGSGLLRNLPLIRSIFESVRAVVTIPFTVKFRAGWNDREIVHIELAKLAEDCGLAALALHAPRRAPGLLRSGRLGVDHRPQRRREDSRHRQRRHSLARSRRRHGRRNRLRCRHDWPHRSLQSVDLPPDRAVPLHRPLRQSQRS